LNILLSTFDSPTKSMSARSLVQTGSALRYPKLAEVLATVQARE
jgi:hypothetical protein